MNSANWVSRERASPKVQIVVQTAAVELIIEKE